jgi:cytochrome c oxidase assembly protein subunit 15
MASLPAPTDATIAARHPRLLRAARAALIANLGIVVTGGLVRVTGSGLGCAEWPRCTEDSFVPVGGADAGWHAAIEFGNRLLTFAVLAATLAVLFEVRRSRPLPPALVRLAWILPLGVLAQAVIGGITVLTGLHWWTVSVHFLASMLLILAAVALLGLVRTPADAPKTAPGLRHAVSALTIVAFIVLVLGTMVTAAGPHGGDVSAPRIGIDIRLLAIAHADGVWLLLGLTVATLFMARHAGHPELARAVGILLVISLAQGAVGYLQYWLGIPRELVSLHVVGATLVWLAAARTWVIAHRPGMPTMSSLEA